MALYFILTLMLLTSAGSNKYVYIRQYLDWFGAQRHCKTYYTDLAPISSEYDTSLLRQLAGSNPPVFFWFGLTMNITSNKWMWSGGGKVTKFFWDNGQPDKNDIAGLLINFKWHDAPFNHIQTHFFCYKVHVIKEEKTWEEALQYCRTHHSDLASVASETEMMLMKKELSRKDYTTERLWIGLHYFPGDWMWVDQQPLVYEAWGPGGKPWCPDAMCGALEVTGPSVVNGVKVEDVKVWNAHSCNKRLHFLCY